MPMRIVLSRFRKHLKACRFDAVMAGSSPGFVGCSAVLALHKPIRVCYTPRPCAAAVAEW